jgi:hypothetical protein
MTTPLINAVGHSFATERSRNTKTVLDWICHARNADEADLKNFSPQFFDYLQKTNPSTENKRYQFKNHSTEREKVLKTVFDVAFVADPDAITAEAEKQNGYKTAAFPRWKKVCWIDIPQNIAVVLNNPIIQIAVTIVVLYQAYHRVKAAHESLKDLIGRALPIIINNTPIEVIRAGNKILDMKDWVRNNVLKTLFYMWLAQRVVLMGPHIPLITPLVRRLDLWSLFNILTNTPQTLATFAWKTALNAGMFTFKTCNQMGEYLQGRVEKATDERLALCKKYSYQAWKSLMTPAAA